jgi:hypothetical protein
MLCFCPVSWLQGSTVLQACGKCNQSISFVIYIIFLIADPYSYTSEVCYEIKRIINTVLIMLLTTVINGVEYSLKFSFLYSYSRNCPLSWNPNIYYSVPKGCHWILFWVSWIYSISLRSLLILYFCVRLGLPNICFLSGFLIKFFDMLSSPSYNSNYFRKMYTSAYIRKTNFISCFI